MKSRMPVITLLILTSTSAFADAVPKAIKTRYSEIQRAIQTLDISKFSTFFSNDFVTIDPAGKSTSKKGFLADVGQLMKSSTAALPHEQLLSASMKDGVVGVKFDFKLKLHSKTGVTSIHEVGTDYWKQINGKWLMVKTVDTKFEMQMPKPGKKTKID